MTAAETWRPIASARPNQGFDVDQDNADPCQILAVRMTGHRHGRLEAVVDSRGQQRLPFPFVLFVPFKTIFISMYNLPQGLRGGKDESVFLHPLGFQQLSWGPYQPPWIPS